MHHWLIPENIEMREWLSIFDFIFRRGVVGEENGIRFIIHTAERGHNLPHLHAKYQGKEAVIEAPTPQPSTCPRAPKQTLLP